jgi:hypothetical protein
VQSNIYEDDPYYSCTDATQVSFSAGEVFKIKVEGLQETGPRQKSVVRVNLVRVA